MNVEIIDKNLLRVIVGSQTEKHALRTFLKDHNIDYRECESDDGKEDFDLFFPGEDEN